MAEQVNNGKFIDDFQDDTYEWMLSVIALRWNLPLFRVARWKFKEVKRHYKCLRYEIERHNRDAENQEE